MNAPIRLGIVGTNFVSDWLCEAARKTEGLDPCAVYSRTQEKGNAFAASHGIGRVYTDWDAFLSSDIDAVYIATPNICHAAQAEDAIRRGKHVLVEKPATLSEAQFTRLLALAKEHGGILLEAMRPAHDPAMERAREAMRTIGPLRRAAFDFCQYSSRYDRFRRGEILNAFNPALGNAALMDIGVYALHCCVMLLGEPESVTARSVLLHNGMEGMGTVLLGYPGMTAEVVYSKIIESTTPSVLLGEDGAVTLGKLSTVESVSRKMRGGEEEVLVGPREGDNMIYETADFVRAVRGGTNPEKWQKNTILTLRIMDAIRRQNGIVFPGE